MSQGTGNKTGQRKEQAAATRKKLLDSAQKLFGEKGYKGTSVREINRSVNLGDGLLYHYFPEGKQQIFQAIVEENVRQTIQALDYSGKIQEFTLMPLGELLETVYTSFIRVVEEHLDILRILFRENEVRGVVTKEQMMHLAGKRAPWLPKVLEKKMERGEVRPMDCAMAARTMNAILMNHVMIKIFSIGPSNIELEEERRRLIAHQVSLWQEEDWGLPGRDET